MCCWTVMYVIHMEEKYYLAHYKNLLLRNSVSVIGMCLYVMSFRVCVMLPNVWTVTLPGEVSYRCRSFLIFCSQVFYYHVYMILTWALVSHGSSAHPCTFFLDSFPHLCQHLSHNLQWGFFFFLQKFAYFSHQFFIWLQ